MSTYLRYYDHSIFPEYSGIEYFDGTSWARLEKKFSKENLEKWRMKYKNAVLIECPLRDLL